MKKDDVGCGGGCSLSGFEACVRGVKIIDNTKIHVYDCVNGSTIVNMYMIPYKIYGAKNII